jgi:hypothetical protein
MLKQKKATYMEYRLYPNPINDICTPFVYDKSHKKYLRYFLNPNPQLVVVQNNGVGINVTGCTPEQIIGREIPQRELFINYIKAHCICTDDFMDYLKNTYIVPTFPLSEEEAFVKTVIRQIISAAQARKLFSNFVRIFGYEKNGIYGFPNSAMTIKVSLKDLEQLGLGFRAKRILSGLKMIRDGGEITELRGIGPWSKCILEVELNRNYSLYPFWDKSGKRIKEVCGIDLKSIAQDNGAIAGSIYLYAASYLETK